MMTGIGTPISQSRRPFPMIVSPWAETALMGGERDGHGTVPKQGRRLSVDDDGANAFARMHQVEALVDLLELQNVSDHRVDRDLAVHIPVDDLRNVGASLRAAERGAAPVAAGDELEGAGGDLPPCFGDADDDRRAPAAMAGLERGAHHL